MKLINSKFISLGQTSIYGVSIKLYTGYADDGHDEDDELIEITSTLGWFVDFPSTNNDIVKNNHYTEKYVYVHKDSRIGKYTADCRRQGI